MVIEQTANEIIFRLPNTTPLDDLQNLADYLRYREISKKSKASEKDLDELVKSAKKGRWERTKQQLMK